MFVTVSIPSSEALDSFKGMLNLLMRDEATARFDSLVPDEVGVDRRYTDAEAAIVLPSHATRIVERLLFSRIRHLCYGDSLSSIISLIMDLTFETSGASLVRRSKSIS